ncbi:MAG TPA: AtpZ/AtpI family protein [Anaerolineae bacterium]|nr:AtpZ/AtpI family protein [Anaerolineae bacterium]
MNQIDRQWVVRLAVMLLAFSILPVILGILLDWRLHTSPIITLFMMLLGFNVGIVTIARNIGDIYSHVAPETHSSRIGGDQ